MEIQKKYLILGVSFAIVFALTSFAQEAEEKVDVPVTVETQDPPPPAWAKTPALNDYIDFVFEEPKRGPSDGAYLEFNTSNAKTSFFLPNTKELNNTWATKTLTAPSYTVDVAAKFTKEVQNNLDYVLDLRKNILNGKTISQFDQELEKAKKNKSSNLKSLLEQEDQLANILDAEVFLKRELRDKTQIQKASALYADMMQLTLSECSKSWKSTGGMNGDDKIFRCSPEVSAKIAANMNDIQAQSESIEEDVNLPNDPDLLRHGYSSVTVNNLFNEGMSLGNNGYHSGNYVMSLYGASGMGCSGLETPPPICEVGINTIEVFPDDYDTLTAGDKYVWEKTQDAKVETEVMVATKDTTQDSKENAKPPTDSGSVAK